MNPTAIKPYQEMDLKIYAYTLPEVPSHNGLVKIGSTSRTVERRVWEQVGTAGLTPHILFHKPAQRSDGSWFSDKDLHRFLMSSGIEKRNPNNYADEWFFFNGDLEKAEALTDEFISRDYDENETEAGVDYVLRNEQQLAVEQTLEYYNSGDEPREFLWNAKPRFGKTLTCYDFVRRINATNVLIVTNRPAIANSWFDDFKKFISWQEPGMEFVSETDSLKGRALSREQFTKSIDPDKLDDVSQITFISLQDLKGAKFAGGEHEKLRWVGDLDWDLLVVDEAHEGVDTKRTDVAFDKINRKFTLHLSGTPFKALADNKFNENQIFNWSYVDEQEAKLNWDYTFGSNPYEDLPQLSLFTYQMSKMVEKEVAKGLTLEDGTNVDYTFDLHEFFRVKDNGRFEHETSVGKFLDNLSSGRFPFAPDQHAEELNHTFWLLPRVNSAKALEKMLKEHPVFGEYHVVLAAGDGVSIDTDLTLEEALDFRKNEKSFNKVRKAIAENEKTITLSVGQLTTGITIPEWSAVLMLNNIKSPSLYFQAAFRAQNPYIFVRDEKLYRKENAYIFDFAPDRTLQLYDEFAINLSGESVVTTSDRKDRLRELLNFFPVIGEDDEGNMHQLDATEVLTIPARITSREVVKRGFMSNLLFANIAGIFSGDSPFKEILDKIPPEKNKRLQERRPVEVTNPMIDEKGDISIPRTLVINETEDIFGPAIFRVLERVELSDAHDSPPLIGEVSRLVNHGFDEFKERFGLTKAATDSAKDEVITGLIEDLAKNTESYSDQVSEIEERFSEEIQGARAANDLGEVARLEAECERKKSEATRNFVDGVKSEVKEALAVAVEKQITKEEEVKKKKTEDDVRDHLRGFARTIPAFLMAYGDETTTLANFDENIDEPTFEELTSISISEFRKLRDGFEYVDDDGNNKEVPGLFNEMVFNASIKEFFATKDRLSNYFDESLTEDIFDYIPPQKTNQIFTPKRVVKMMVDLVAEHNPGIFSDSNAKFVDLYAKSGLYITEIVKRLNEGLEEQIPNEEERIKWILENQVHAFAPSNIIYNIVKNYVFSNLSDISTKNIVEIDLTQNALDGTMNLAIRESFGGEDLKFDVVIGNPPYQQTDGGNNASAKPIYHLFVQQAKLMNPRYLSMITPSRWFSGGKGLDQFRTDMLADDRIRELHDYFDATECFPGIDISGGVSYFLWDRDNRGECKVTSIRGSETSIMVRPLMLPGTESFVRFNEALSILQKVHQQDFVSFADHVSSRKPFGLPTNVQVKDTKTRGDVKIYAYPNNGYIEETKIERNLELLSKTKVLISYVYGERGDFPYLVIGKPFIGEIGSCCSETYLVARVCESSGMAKNVITYMCTRLFRFLVLLNKNTQHATSKVYAFVPDQDFSEPWTDERLYAKYNLTNDEVAFIESIVRPMDLD